MLVNARTPIVFILGLTVSLVFGWLVFPGLLYRSEPQPLGFSHSAHTGEQTGMTCDMCHEFGEAGEFKGIPSVSKCVDCHATAIGSTESERRLVEEYVVPGKEIPWKVYSRQPDNAYFPHAVHVTKAGVTCEECHGPHGSSDSLKVYQVNRITGYSRDIWGRDISGLFPPPGEGMKMDRCVSCHKERKVVDSCIDCHK